MGHFFEYLRELFYIATPKYRELSTALQFHGVQDLSKVFYMLEQESTLFGLTR
jgi:hypothetical protein